MVYTEANTEIKHYVKRAESQKGGNDLAIKFPGGLDCITIHFSYETFSFLIFK